MGRAKPIGRCRQNRRVLFRIPLTRKDFSMPRHDQTPEQIEAETDRLLSRTGPSLHPRYASCRQKRPLRKSCSKRRRLRRSKRTRIYPKPLENNHSRTKRFARKKKKIRQCSCGGDRKHLGYAPKTIVRFRRLKKRMCFASVLVRGRTGGFE